MSQPPYNSPSRKSCNWLLLNRMDPPYFRKCMSVKLELISPKMEVIPYTPRSATIACMESTVG